MRVLIMGLPGAGKTTLAQALQLNLRDSSWYNADVVRKLYDDWDFSYVGRLRQATRMRELADADPAKYVICDFVAPLPEMRHIFNADVTVWVDTIPEGRFEDTNKAFVKPATFDIRVTTQDVDKWTPIIMKRILGAWQKPSPGV